jgi:hypothetical protein
MRRTLVALAAAAMLSMPMVGSPSEALAQRQDADGLVVVQVGDVTVTDAIDVNAAAALIAQACGIQALNGVNVLNILSAIDSGAHQHTFCRGSTGPVTARNN